MQPRITNPAVSLTGAMEALQALGDVVGKSGLPHPIIHLVGMRASQINGCGVCLDGAWRFQRTLGETDERLFALPGWREAPYYSDAERAALALTEAVTRLADRPDPVPDEIWAEAARHVRRAGTGRPGARHRQPEPVEPAERRDPPGGGRVEARHDRRVAARRLSRPTGPGTGGQRPAPLTVPGMTDVTSDGPAREP